MAWIRTAMVLSAIALAWPQSPAQAPAQAPQPFRLKVDRVAVDVNVVGPEGRPLPDLAAADFSLQVDGRPREVLSAEFIAVPHLSEQPVRSAEDFDSNTRTGGARLIMILVDRGSISPGTGKSAFEAAGRFVDGLNPDDRVSLVSIPSGPQVDFTTHHELVRSLLRTIDGAERTPPSLHPIGVSDALAIQRDRGTTFDNVVQRECGSVGQAELMACRRDIREDATVIGDAARERARNTMIGLRSVLQRLTSTDTPKTIVLISQGFVLDRDWSVLSWFGPMAAAAHATIYAIHLDPSEFSASQARMRTTPIADRAALREGLEAVATLGRGDVFTAMSDADNAFRRIGLELSGYYLLSFEPAPGERDGLAHKIKVGVDRPGVTIRARREFTAGKPATKSAEQLIVEMLRDPVLATDIPLRVTTYSFEDPGSNRLRVLVAAELDRRSDPGAHVAIGYALIDGHGKAVMSQLEKSLTTPVAAGTGAQTYVSAALVEPGDYTLKLAAVDAAGRRASVERHVEAKIHGFGQVHVTDLLIADSAAPSMHGSVSPTVTAAFTGSMLYGYLELAGEVPAVLQHVAVSLQIAQTPTSLTIDSAELPLQAPGGNGRVRVAGGSIPIALLEPGDYVARAVITDSGRQIGQVVRPFKILPRASAGS